ncbi:MAG: hypothetical protein ACYC6C_01980 [Coriobacteriia bacterium]
MGKPEGRIVGIDALRGLAIMMVVAHTYRPKCSVLLYNIYRRLPKRVAAPQAAVGRRSIGIYAIHIMLIQALLKAGHNAIGIGSGGRQ